MLIKNDLAVSRRQFIANLFALGSGLALGNRLGWAAAPTTDRLVIAQSIGISSLHPYAFATSPLYGIWGHIMESLVDTDFERRGYHGELAESWNAKGTDWTFKIRSGVTFHDGTPLTAKDVAYSFDRIMNDKKSLQGTNLSDLQDMKVPDDQTLVLITKKPKVALLPFLYTRAVLSQKAAERLGDKLDDHAIGTGPYRFAAWERGSYFTMRKHDKYWGKPSQIREIIWRPIKEDAARIAALESGQADIIMNVPPHEVERLKRHPRVRVELVRGLRVVFIALNPAYKPFDSKLVRQAFNYAVDQEAIIKHVLEDQAYPLKGLLGPQMTGYDQDIENYPYDPEKAKKLLAEAGYPNGLTIDFYSFSGRYVKDRETAEAMINQMAKAGIRANLKTPEYAIYDQEYNAGKYAMYMIGRGSIVDPEGFYVRYFRSGRSKRLSYKNEEFDKLFDQQSETFDSNRREELLRRMGRILHEDCPTIPLYNTADAYAVRRDLIWKPRPDEKIQVAGARFQS